MEPKIHCRVHKHIPSDAILRRLIRGHTLNNCIPKFRTYVGPYHPHECFTPGRSITNTRHMICKYFALYLVKKEAFVKIHSIKFHVLSQLGVITTRQEIRLELHF
jgi:hypothetical protein